MHIDDVMARTTAASFQATEDITHCCCHCQYPNLQLVGDYHQRERERKREVSPCLARD